jgi:CubicO group peptidase (beta-lactamase class C family)
VAEKGKVIYKKGFGMANMEWNIPNQANTKHRLGSITKQFTAVLIVQLAAEGKLDLYAPVSKYLPDYSKSSGDKITSHHLLTHTSGIPNYTSFPNFMRDMSREPYEPMEFLKMFADSTLEFTPGERFAYSNSGYFLLGAIIEKITGKSYEKVLQEKIFDPLKLNDTGYDHHNTIIKNRASGYEGRGSNYINAPYLDMSIPYAAGSMYSTVEDLFAWDQALYTEKLLPKKYMDLLFGKYIAAFGGYYGYGWDISKIPVGNSTDSLETIGHGGGINGFNTLITRFPSDRSSVILLNNTGVAPLEEITRSVAGILYGKTYDLPKKSVAFSLLDVINEEGIEVGLSYYREIKDSEGYDLSENEMNNAGYQLLQSGKVKEAAEVFKLNMEAFPASFNVYDSYAEAQMVQGQNDLAIKYYKKSIEINPGNQNGIDMLKKLGVDVSEVVKDAVVPDHILQSYVGKYELMPGFILTVTREGSQLKTQATGQSVVDIYPRSENVFYLKVITAQLTFNRNSEGRVESVTLLQGGQEITGKKLSD